MSLFRAALEAHRDGGAKLYHYSKEKHPTLKTLELTSTISQGERKEAEESVTWTHDPGPYFQHISFFFEPAPLDIISRVFDGNHAFWFAGAKLYEHVVLIDHLPDFKYRIVESDAANALFYKEYKHINWEIDSQVGVFFNKLYKIQKENHEVGAGLTAFNEALPHQLGKIREAYLALPKRPNWEELKKKYAATVPHVMIYPKGGEIEPSEIRQVVVK